jgi:hypothetical protein
MNLKEQQADLIFKLGLLLSPLQEIADHPERHDAHSRARAGGKFFADAPKPESEVRSFTQREPGHDYQREWRKLHVAFHALRDGVREHLDNPVALSALLKEQYAAIRNGILAIPVSVDAVILEAHSPFSTYCVVKDLCQTVTERLIWVDRYLDSSLFHRYLRDVSINVHVTLLTWPPSKREAKEFSEFLDVSRLYAAERGPDNYRLVVHSDIHDRWLCCDGQIYALGGSVKDASQRSHFTLSKVDSTEENFDKIDHLLNTGTEIYGPTQHEHC